MDIGGVRDEGLLRALLHDAAQRSDGCDAGTSTGKNDGRSSADGMNRGSRSHLKTMLAFTS
jgi:hypothetical protein